MIVLGALINRDFTTPVGKYHQHNPGCDIEGPIKEGLLSPTAPPQRDKWRPRQLRLLGFRTTILTPNTAVSETSFLSRVLLRFPFITEIICWALIYSVYQMGRGFLAQRLNDNTIDMACQHALQLIRLERPLHIFWQLDIQRHFLQYPDFMYWINRIYSYVHLPATITFLVGLYWFAITRHRGQPRRDSLPDPYLYESRRRSLTIYTWSAFCAFSSRPCMPPRLLGDSESSGEFGELARSFEFVDTVRGRDGAVSMLLVVEISFRVCCRPSFTAVSPSSAENTKITNLG